MAAQRDEVRPAEGDPARIALEAGIESRNAARVRWFVRGTGTATVTYTGQKGGTLSREVTLEEQ